MRNKSKIKKLVIILGLIFALLPSNSFTLFNDQGGIEITIENQDLNPPRISGYWTTNFIHVDGNWSYTAGNYSWCSGDGSWSDPYTIENIIINASNSPTGNGVLINNSKSEYFIIRNCTIYNAVNGIMLENTDNGTLKINNCTKNTRGIWLYNNCRNNTISNNIADGNLDTGITLSLNCDNNTISGNRAGSFIQYIGICLLDGCDNNNISNNNANKNEYGIRIQWGCNYNTITNNMVNANKSGVLLESCHYNTISGNIANTNKTGIYLRYCNYSKICNNIANNNIEGFWVRDCNYNTFSGNSANNNSVWGLANDGNNNMILENYMYFNKVMALVLGGANNVIERNIFVSEDENYVYDYGTNIYGLNYYLPTAPYLYIDVIEKLFSTTEFIVTIKISSGLGFDLFIQNIEIWWDEIAVLSKNILKLGDSLYNISLTPIFVEIGQDPVLLSIIITSANHWDKNFEMLIAVEPPKIVKYLQVEIVEHFYSLEYFNFTIFVFNESGHGIDLATIQTWWNNIDVSMNITNLGDGFYCVSIDPITVSLGEEPILLSMIVSADGYEDKHFETYIAVDPTTLEKGPGGYGEEFPLLILIIAITLTAGGIGVAFITVRIVKKRRLIKLNSN